MEIKNIEFSHFSLLILECQTGEFTQSIYCNTADNSLVIRNWIVSFWHGTNRVSLNIRKYISLVTNRENQKIKVQLFLGKYAYCKPYWYQLIIQ